MKFTTPALALGLAITAAPAFAQYNSMPPPVPQQVPPAQTPKGSDAAPAPAAKDGSAHPSKGAIKAIIELQKAVNANDTASIPAALSAAQAAASTNDDRYVIGQLQLKAALAAKDNSAMSAAVATLAGSNYLPAKTVSGLYLALGSTLYGAKQFDQASNAFERALALDPTNPVILSGLGETRFSQGRAADALTNFQKVIQIRAAAGQKPEEAIFKRAVAIAYESKNPAAVDLSRQWIAAYPSPDSWRNGIALYQNFYKPDVESVLDLLRLMRAAGSLSNPADYSLYATAAADQGNFAESQAVIDEGLAAKNITATSPLVRDIITGLKSKSKATEADLVTAMKSATTGKALVRIGDRYFALNNYAKAAELYRQSIGKADVDQNVANLHLGMALARGGNKAGAIAAFNQVNGSLAGVAKYWLIYANQMA